MAHAKQLIIFIGLLIVSSGFAQASSSIRGCDYISRSNAKVKEIMSSLHPALVGWWTCAQTNPEANRVFVAHFTQLDDDGLVNFLKAHMRTQDHTASQMPIIWKSKGEFEKRQIIMNSVTLQHAGVAESVLSHYAFVAKAQDGTYLVFIHSMMDSESKVIRNTLVQFHDKLTSLASVNDVMASLVAAQK